MVKKVLGSLVVLSLVIGGGSVLQAMGEEIDKGKSQVSKKVKDEKTEAVSKKPEIKFAGVDASKLKVAKVERLTYDAHKTEYKSYMYPKWSPDGKMITFTSTNSFEGAEWVEELKYRGLWIINADGSNKRKLTDEEGIGYEFEWTEDSESIVYKVGKTIKEIDVNTKESHKVISAKESISPMIKHPSGEFITVVDNEVIKVDKNEAIGRLRTSSIKKSKVKDKNIIYSLNSKVWKTGDNGKNEILGDGENAVLSPDSKMICKIFYEGGSRISHGMVTIDKGYKIFLGGIAYTPSWSPDGSKIIVADVRVEEQTGIYPKSHRIKFVTGGPMYADLHIYNIYEPDTKKWKENLENIEKKSFVYKTGKGGYNLTNTKDEAELSPNWSPDGEKIVYVSGENGDIYVITLGVSE